MHVLPSFCAVSCLTVGLLGFSLEARAEALQPEPTFPLPAATPMPLGVQVVGMTLLGGKILEVPVNAHGGRVAVGPRYRIGPKFTLATLGMVEAYVGQTQRQLDFSTRCFGLATDVTVAYEWLHWELQAGLGANNIARVTSDAQLQEVDLFVGLSVSPELRLTSWLAVAPVLGVRWWGTLSGGVLGFGLRT